jgi:hypothetical protein
MVNRRAAFAAAVVAGCVFSSGVLAQKNEEKSKQSDAQKKEIQTIVKLVDDVAAGQPAPNDLGLSWTREDFLKALNNKQYVPFTLTLDSSKLSGGNVALYWRVVAKSEAPAAAPAPAPAAGQKKDDEKKRPEYAYEDISFLPVSGSTPMRVSRSFTVPGGSYDVFVVAKEPTPEKAPKNAPPPKISVLKQTVNVPDFWNGEFSTSSVIITQRIDPLPAPLTQQQQIERPYALGSMELVPAWDSKLSKKSELSTFLLIYNPKTDSGNKPDVIVEYNFYSKSGGAEKFFNKTNPQNLNAQTLPPQFDLAAGHQLQSGEAVPLASFPEGEYRLEIKVTDKIANKSLTRDVTFTVTAS